MLGCKAWATYILVSWPLYYIICVLFGAPLFTDIVATATLSTVLVICTTVPVCFWLEPVSYFLDFFFGLRNRNSAEKNGRAVALFSILGCFISSIVIPLDWDLWWQRYPVPNIFGTVAGLILGLISVFIFRLCNRSGKQSTD